jgi:predicted RNA-binding protein with PUA-like domain
MIAMRQGDLAFFYHSNCKTPGIVGVMEIVEESAPDGRRTRTHWTRAIQLTPITDSAFDPKHPYYDPKSSRDNPKWHCVHVGFKEKFPTMIPLDKIKALAKEGSPISEMQLIKRSRLSVCKVSPTEWEYLISLAAEMDADAK